MANQIHPSAVVASGAELGADVVVGPYCVLGPRVRLGAGTRLQSHVVIEGHTTLGAECEVYPFASLGQRTQDLKYQGGTPRAEIGDRTVIREYVTVNTATADGDVTRVGSGCLLMAYAHVAHDCQVGDGVIIANCGTLAGHVTLEDESILGGLSAVHQFVRIGARSMIGGCSKITQDVPPYMLADGHPAVVRGLNRVGLSRRGVPAETQRGLKEAYRLLFRRGLPVREACTEIAARVEATPERDVLLRFIEESKRGICRGAA